ncbi:MAG: hypothetical protein QM791_06140 [Ferruginibacter sp.]
MQRVSITTLEKFSRYMNEVSSFDTEESLIESIKGLFLGNDKTKFGSAYHKLLEGDVKVTGKGLQVTADNEIFVFALPVAKPALDYKKAFPLMVQEMNLRHIYNTNHFPIQISGRLDGINGAHVRDAKCKFRTPDWREYMESCQWKFYLDILGLQNFYYDVFEIKGFTELPKGKPYIIKDVTVIPHEPLECISYPFMHEELVQLIDSFLEYVQMKGLLQYLKPALPMENELTF